MPDLPPSDAAGALCGTPDAFTDGCRRDMERALKAYTRGGAYLTREEQRKGTIEPGRLADMIVLSADLLAIPPEQILSTKVDLTVLGGRVVYERAP